MTEVAAVAAELSRLSVTATPEYPDRDHFVEAQELWRDEEMRYPEQKYTCTPEQVEGILEKYLDRLQKAFEHFQTDPMYSSVTIHIWEANGVELMDRLVPLARMNGWEPKGAVESFAVNCHYKFKRA